MTTFVPSCSITIHSTITKMTNWNKMMKMTQADFSLRHWEAKLYKSDIMVMKCLFFVCRWRAAALLIVVLSIHFTIQQPPADGVISSLMCPFNNEHMFNNSLMDLFTRKLPNIRLCQLVQHCQLFTSAAASISTLSKLQLSSEDFFSQSLLFPHIERRLTDGIMWILHFSSLSRFDSGVVCIIWKSEKPHSWV